MYPFNADGIVYASSLMRDFINKFNTEAKPLHIPSIRWSSSYHEVQEILYELAMKYPIVMDDALYEICQDFSMEDLESSTDLTNWCGCHLSPVEYQNYATIFGLQKECAPTCTAEGTIPGINGEGKADRCTQSVCIINDVNFTASQSKLGNLSITQLCTHCKSRDSCKCVIDGVDISKIDGSIKAVQELCTTTLCTIQNPSNPNTKINIPCSGPSILYYQYKEKVRERERRKSGFVISLCFLLISMLVAILLLKYL